MTRNNSVTVRIQIGVNNLIVIASLYIFIETLVRLYKRPPGMESSHYIHALYAIALIVSGALMIRELGLKKRGHVRGRSVRGVFSILNITLGIFLITIGSEDIMTTLVPERRMIIFLIAGAIHIPYGIWISPANTRANR
ncbi:MAG TPA: hypothetical protein VD927_03295 [Chryseosolibacter sp.]|nr:hypothetical protein [Chryseosolibacter sp.]